MHFGYGIEWLNIDYPSSFTMDPKSHKGEAKWWAKFDDPNSGLSIEVDSFGYVSERLREEEGYKSPEEFIEKEIIGKDAKKTEQNGYYRFVSTRSKEVLVIYLQKAAEWGRCYQSLRFTFPKGEYSIHMKVIDSVIKSAVPSFAISSEQAAPVDAK